MTRGYKKRYLMQLQKMSKKGLKFFRQYSGWEDGWQNWFAGVSREQAEYLLDKRLGVTAAYVSRQLGHTIAQDEFDALVSWAEELTAAQIKSSRVWAAINAKKWGNVAPAINQWKSRNGKFDIVLANRRSEEARLYESGYYR